MEDASVTGLEQLSRSIRREILSLTHRTKSAHIGSCFSAVELLTALYFRIMAVSPEEPYSPERDVFILGKGHACAALYAVLFARGFLSREDLEGFAVNGGILEQHPCRDPKRGIEVSTGSLGHGLSIGAGMALAAKKDGRAGRVFVLMSDGELNEGSVWEAAMFSSQHRLDNLIALVDVNGLQALGYTKDIMDMAPLGRKWESFGWTVREVDGHDYGQVLGAFEKVPMEAGRPAVVLARTVKGKGVSFMEDALLWHYRPPDDGEYRAALKELGYETGIL